LQLVEDVVGPSIRVSAFRWVPPFAQGLARDFRVRWALEEAGLPYEERLIGPEDQSTDAYRALQPFGQIPAIEEDGLPLFESGAIVLHIAERSDALMPADPAGRARVLCWAFAALNSIEPRVSALAEIDLFHADAEWGRLRRPAAEQNVKARLTALAARFNGRDYLEDRFTAADILMVTVLRNLRHTDVLAQFPVLEAYRQRCEARPAFQKAMADHLAPSAKNAPPVKVN
jgi:glutathione S-transferase